MQTPLPCKKALPKIEKNKGNKTKNRTTDIWDDWAPRWRGKADPAAGDSVQDRQERLAPTVAVAHPDALDTPDAPQRMLRRRAVDARLWDDMSVPQQRAVLQIAAAYEAMSRGLGRVTSDWARVPGGGMSGTMSDNQARFLDLYMDWARACATKKIAHAMIIDVICFGKSCRMVDQERRQRKGAARANLMAGLSLYAALRGWR